MPFTFPGPVPKEALAFFRAKGWAVGFDHRDVWGQEHAVAFTVAKATNMDVLESIRGAVDDALANGIPFQQFKKNLQPTLEKLGWWGRKEMVDPLTGEKRLVQLGSPRRLHTIYRANLRTARAAGVWERAQRTKGTHPYFLYRLGPSENHREEHLRWEGLLLPVDDPFWQTHFPPNGWGCKCWIRQVSKREYERLKGTGKYLTSAPEITTREWVNKRTGEVLQVPRGIDPGWDTNPGAIQRQAQVLGLMGDKVGRVAPDIGAATVRDLVGSEGFASWYLNPQGAFPVGLLNHADARAIGASTAEVRLSRETADKQKVIHPEIQAAEYAWVQDAIDHGRKIYEARSMIYILQKPKGYVAIVKTTQTGKGVWLTSFRRLSSSQSKQDKEIQRLLGKGRE